MNPDEEKKKNSLNEPSEVYGVQQDADFERRKLLAVKAYQESRQRNDVGVDSKTLRKLLHERMKKWS